LESKVLHALGNKLCIAEATRVHALLAIVHQFFTRTHDLGRL
jgi:hypothetical protein